MLETEHNSTLCVLKLCSEEWSLQFKTVSRNNANRIVIMKKLVSRNTVEATVIAIDCSFTPKGMALTNEMSSKTLELEQ